MPCISQKDDGYGDKYICYYIRVTAKLVNRMAILWNRTDKEVLCEVGREVLGLYQRDKNTKLVLALSQSDIRPSHFCTDRQCLLVIILLIVSFFLPIVVCF